MDKASDVYGPSILWWIYFHPQFRNEVPFVYVGSSIWIDISQSFKTLTCNWHCLFTYALGLCHWTQRLQSLVRLCSLLPVIFDFLFSFLSSIDGGIGLTPVLHPTDLSLRPIWGRTFKFVRYTMKTGRYFAIFRVEMGCYFWKYRVLCSLLSTQLICNVVIEDLLIISRSRFIFGHA